MVRDILCFFLCIIFMSFFALFPQIDVIKSTLSMNKDYAVNTPINMLESKVYSRKPNYRGLLDSNASYTNQIIDSGHENHQQNHFMENA